MVRHRQTLFREVLYYDRKWLSGTVVGDMFGGTEDFREDRERLLEPVIEIIVGGENVNAVSKRMRRR